MKTRYLESYAARMQQLKAHTAQEKKTVASWKNFEVEAGVFSRAVYKFCLSILVFPEEIYAFLGLEACPLSSPWCAVAELLNYIERLVKEYKFSVQFIDEQFKLHVKRHVSMYPNQVMMTLE